MTLKQKLWDLEGRVRQLEEHVLMPNEPSIPLETTPTGNLDSPNNAGAVLDEHQGTDYVVTTQLPVSGAFGGALVGGLIAGPIGAVAVGYLGLLGAIIYNKWRP